MSTDRRLKGTIEKRGENKYRLTVSAGFDADGRRIRHRRPSRPPMIEKRRRSWPCSSRKLREAVITNHPG